MFTQGQVNITVFRLFRKWKVIDAIYLWQENSTLSIIHSTMCAKHCDNPGVAEEGGKVFGLLLGRRTAHSPRGV